MAHPNDALTLDVVYQFPAGPTMALTLDASLPTGSTLALFGPSGSGKTTALRLLAGLDHPQQGHIRFHGDVWVDCDAGVWVTPQDRRIGLVTQGPTLFPHLTIRENIAYGAPMDTDHGRSVDDLARICGIGELLGRRPSQLSGGQYQRVTLARAMAVRPRLLLLDEPFAALDMLARLRLRADLRLLLQRWNVPALIVTHDRNDALALADQTAIVAAGAVKQVGNTADVFNRPADLEVANIVGVDTVVPGVVGEIDDGMALLRIGDHHLRAVARDRLVTGQRVFACIRAEDVVLDRTSKAPTSARNRLAASVTAVVSEGMLDRVTLDCGFFLNALVTRQGREELGLTVGSTVVAVIKATAIHVVERN